MRLARLRHQMLIAMGLPACWIQQSPDPSGPPDPPPSGAPPKGSQPDPWTTQTPRTTETRPDPPPPPPRVTTQTSSRACVLESVCGRSDARSGSTCGPYGDSLESFGKTSVSVTRLSFAAHPPELRTFALDSQATAAYQQGVSVSAATRPLYCCYSQCTPSRPATLQPQVAAGHRIVPQCVPSPATPAAPFSSAPHADNPDCPERYAKLPYIHGTNSQCCYGQTERIEEPQERRYYRGRAARVDGTARVAAIDRGTSWIVETGRLALDGLAAMDRARLRDAWAKAAQMEHASIAAFSALSLRLLALGAPADLVERTHAAALDEIRHARVAFALASAYAGHALHPGAFSDAGQLAIAGTLAELAIETFVDGCVEEASAALEASRASEHARDPVIAAALREIADDETRHAELAWAILAWCVRVDPSIVPRLVAECERLVAEAPPDGDPGAGQLAAHGVLSDAALARCRADTLRGVVAPCLAALVEHARGSSPPHARA